MKMSPSLWKKCKILISENMYVLLTEVPLSLVQRISGCWWQPFKLMFWALSVAFNLIICDTLLSAQLYSQSPWINLIKSGHQSNIQTEINPQDGFISDRVWAKSLRIGKMRIYWELRTFVTSVTRIFIANYCMFWSKRVSIFWILTLTIFSTMTMRLSYNSWIKHKFYLPLFVYVGVWHPNFSFISMPLLRHFQ